MQKFFKIMLMIFFTVITTSSFAANPSYTMNATAPCASRVNLYNQTPYTYTVHATYMGQNGVSRKFIMALNAYPYTGSAIMFPIALPEYAVFLQVVRNIDNYMVYSGYVSSDDIYIHNAMKDKKPSATVNHH